MHSLRLPPQAVFPWIHDMLIRDRFFIGGQWVAPSSRETIDVHNAGTGEVMGRVPAGDGEGRRCGGRAPRAARSSRGARPRRTSEPSFSKRFRPALKARADELAQDDRAGSRHAAQDGEPHPGRPADRELRQLREAAERVSFRDERVGNSLVVREPGGRRGRDHALELSAAPDHPEGRAGARRRLHRGAQAFGSRAVQRLHPRRGASRPSGCRRACSTS